ncbi:MAG: fused MFS/spermidine synthase [Lachnospiraceae bacterium]|nr:fused MFS/spermidine synthase [Lachnospiraceae bacterium]
MAVELGASRLLAPYFSSSQIVWTIIIAVIMIAMALGNIYGGRSADKNPNPDVLYRRLIISAVWIAAIPVLGKYIILLISGVLIVTINHNLLIIAAFLACLIIFVMPCFLLGTVTPSLVKYTVDNLDTQGSTVGRLSAFNTIGSIVGTFLPTFITIPTVGTSITFLIFSGIVLILGIIYFIAQKKKFILIIVSTVLYVLCIIFGNSDKFAFWENNLAYEGESVYNYLQVKDDESETILSTNVLFGVQSIRNKDDSLTGMYYDYALFAPLLASKDSDYSDEDVLILGMGTGTYASELKKYLGINNITGVEIDEKIIDISRDYFELEDSIPVVAYDGRAYLSAEKKKYDVIMVDAYQDITIPFQMSSREFFTEVKNHLKPNGIMVLNMNMRSGEKASINEYLSDTVSDVFKNVYYTDVSASLNRELFASNADIRRTNIIDRLKNVRNSELRSFFSEELIFYEKYHVKPKGERCIFTDDKAPVELLGMKVIDEVISDELGYYKAAFKKDGFKGLLEGM